PARLGCLTREVPVAIVGGGPAGLAAAEALAKAGVEVVLLERNAQLGGRLLAAAPEAHAPLVPPVETLGASRVQLEAEVIGLYDDEVGRFVAAVVGHGPRARLEKVYAQRFLLCPGGHARVLPFGNNDLPGVYAGRAAASLLRRH